MPKVSKKFSPGNNDENCRTSRRYNNRFNPLGPKPPRDSPNSDEDIPSILKKRILPIQQPIWPQASRSRRMNLAIARVHDPRAVLLEFRPVPQNIINEYFNEESDHRNEEPALLYPVSLLEACDFRLNEVPVFLNNENYELCNREMPVIASPEEPVILNRQAPIMVNRGKPSNTGNQVPLIDVIDTSEDEEDDLLILMKGLVHHDVPNEQSNEVDSTNESRRRAMENVDAIQMVEVPNNRGVAVPNEANDVRIAENVREAARNVEVVDIIDEAEVEDVNSMNVVRGDFRIMPVPNEEAEINYSAQVLVPAEGRDETLSVDNEEDVIHVLNVDNIVIRADRDDDVTMNEDVHRFPQVIPFTVETLSQSAERLNIRIRVNVRNHRLMNKMENELMVEHDIDNSHDEDEDEPLNLSVRMNNGEHVQLNFDNAHGNNVWAMEEEQETESPRVQTPEENFWDALPRLINPGRYQATERTSETAAYDLVTANNLTNFGHLEPRVNYEIYHNSLVNYNELQNGNGIEDPIEQQRHNQIIDYNAVDNHGAETFNNTINHADVPAYQTPPNFNVPTAHHDAANYAGVDNYVPVLMETALNLSSHNRPRVPPCGYQEPDHNSGNYLEVGNYEEVEEVQMHAVAEEAHVNGMIENSVDLPRWNQHEYDTQERVVLALNDGIQFGNRVGEMMGDRLRNQMQWNYSYNAQDRIPQPQEMLRQINSPAESMESSDESEYSVDSTTGSRTNTGSEGPGEMEQDVMHIVDEDSMESGISTGSCSYFSSDANSERNNESHVEEPSSTVAYPEAPESVDRPRSPPFICDCEGPACRGHIYYWAQPAPPQQQHRQEPIPPAPEVILIDDEFVSENPRTINHMD